VVTGGASTLQVKRDKLFARFYSMGVKKDQILAVLGKESTESVDLEDLAMLIGLGTAIKDKELTVEEAFTIPAAEGEAGPAIKVKLSARLKAEREKRAAAAAATQPPEKEDK
jgi:hypothetical protein